MSLFCVCVCVMRDERIMSIRRVRGANSVEKNIAPCGMALRVYRFQRNIRTSGLSTGGLALSRPDSRCGHLCIHPARSHPRFNEWAARPVCIACRHG